MILHKLPFATQRQLVKRGEKLSLIIFFRVFDVRFFPQKSISVKDSLIIFFSSFLAFGKISKEQLSNSECTPISFFMQRQLQLYLPYILFIGSISLFLMYQTQPYCGLVINLQFKTKSKLLPHQLYLSIISCLQLLIHSKNKEKSTRLLSCLICIQMCNFNCNLLFKGCKIADPLKYSKKHNREKAKATTTKSTDQKYHQYSMHIVNIKHPIAQL